MSSPKKGGEPQAGTELAQPDGSQESAVMQLTPAAHKRHLQGMNEELGGRLSGKVPEAIKQSIARIRVGVDGNLTIEAKPASSSG
jgi:hypothetical protein